ncbi:RNA-dependent RNA polymerase [Mycena chlorophos]|uniref:RNA-dependent RNA polymerase n=1 Tax=Mycena chlorophos TaxID=658473 RepID=A0A8H6TLA3_MYCCL|nr:RNA-dependent RNA polymerase [Mycena chlorophos]
MQPKSTLKKQRATFLRIIIDLRNEEPILERDVSEYGGHESRATRIVGDSKRFMTVAFHRQSKDQHIRAWLEKKEKLYNGTDAYTFLGFTENNVKNGHLLYFNEGADFTVESLKQYFGSGLFDVYRSSGYGRYSARIGLSFSSTAPTIEVPPAEYHVTDDDLHADDGSLTSDGSGLIRDSFARQLVELLNIPTDTSVFQIRHGGFKGTVTRIPDADFDRACGCTGKKLLYRPSMLKYTGGPYMLEIQSISRTPRDARLNKQFIILMLTRGIRMRALEEILQAQLDNIGEMTTNRERALHYVDGELDSDEPPTTLNQELFELLMAGHDLTEPYVALLLHRFQKAAYDSLRSKLNIIVPRSYYLLGVVDPYGVLEENEVYINLPTRGGPQIGKLGFLRNPAYDADGYVVLNGVNKQRLSHIVNAIVFPARGSTSQAARMSGGDLDGDLYFCTANPQLIPRSRPPLPVPPIPEARARAPRAGIGAPYANQPAPGSAQQAARNTQDNMFRDAVTTFMTHRNNFMLGAMSNEFMRRVVQLPELADAPECRGLLPFILAALDALKNDGPMSVLRFAFNQFKEDNPDRPSPPNHQDPLAYLESLVPAPGAPTIANFVPDAQIVNILDALEDADKVQRLREAEATMKKYNIDLRDAIAADKEAAEMNLEDVGESRADRMKRLFFERHFSPPTPANLITEWPALMVKAALFYVTGYANGKQSFAWTGGRYLNWVKASLGGRYAAIPVGPQYRPLRPERGPNRRAGAGRPPSPPPSSHHSSSSSRTLTNAAPGSHTPAAPSVARTGGSRSRRAPSEDMRSSPSVHPSSSGGGSSDNEDPIRSWTRETARANPWMPTPSEYDPSATPSVHSSAPLEYLDSVPASPAPSALTISTDATETTTSRVRRIPLPESVSSVAGSESGSIHVSSRHARQPSASSRSSAATSTTSGRARRVPLPESVASSSIAEEVTATPRRRDRDQERERERERASPVRPAAPPLRRTNSDTTDVDDSEYDVVRRESADEASEPPSPAHVHAQARALGMAMYYNSPPRRVIREATDKTLVDGVYPDGPAPKFKPAPDSLLSPMSLGSVVLESLSASAASSPNVTQRATKDKAREKPTPAKLVMSPTRPETPYLGYQDMQGLGLQMSPDSRSTRPLARSHSEQPHNTYPPRPLGRAATVPVVAEPAPASPSRAPKSATVSVGTTSVTSSPSKHRHTFNMQSGSPGGPLVCRCGEIYKP